MILTQVGPLNVTVTLIEDGSWVALLVGEHPSLHRIGEVAGPNAESALAKLEKAVQALSPHRRHPVAGPLGM